MVQGYSEKLVEVQIDGAPELGHEEKPKIIDQPQPVLQSKNDNPVRIWFDIRISNGLHLSQKNLSYQDLVRMVEKVEGYVECYQSQSFLLCS